jgi:hypothetical protein
MDVIIGPDSVVFLKRHNPLTIVGSRVGGT